MENLPMPRGPKSPFDWRLAAQLLAEGRSTVEVATVLGCSRQTVWRVLRRSPSLRARVAELRRRDRAETGARLLGLREMVVDTIHQAIADGDKRMTRWLADRLGIYRFGLQEEVAELAAAGADQLESEAVIDSATASHIVAAADDDATVASNPVHVTDEADQWDKPVTVTGGNTLSRSAALATRNAAYPYPKSGAFDR